MWERDKLLAACAAEATPELLPHDRDGILDALLLRAWFSAVSGPPMVRKVENT